MDRPRAPSRHAREARASFPGAPPPSSDRRGDLSFGNAAADEERARGCGGPAAAHGGSLRLQSARLLQESVEALVLIVLGVGTHVLHDRVKDVRDVLALL